MSSLSRHSRQLLRSIVQQHQQQQRHLHSNSCVAANTTTALHSNTSTTVSHPNSTSTAAPPALGGETHSPSPATKPHKSSSAKSAPSSAPASKLSTSTKPSSTKPKAPVTSVTPPPQSVVPPPPSTPKAQVPFTPVFSVPPKEPLGSATPNQVPFAAQPGTGAGDNAGNNGSTGGGSILRMGRRLLLINIFVYLSVSIAAQTNDDANRWLWKHFPQLCSFFHLKTVEENRQRRLVKSAISNNKSATSGDVKSSTTSSPAAAASTVTAPIAAVGTKEAALPANTPSINDPLVKARMDEALKATSESPVPVVTPVVQVPSNPIVEKQSAPVAPKSTPPAAVAVVVAPIQPVPAFPKTEFEELLSLLSIEESSLADFVRSQESTIFSELSELEAELKSRQIRHLQTLEIDQSYTLQSLTQRQDHALFKQSYAKHQPRLDEFRQSRLVEEENRWRRRLYDGLKQQNEAMSKIADDVLQQQERLKRYSYTAYITRLKNAGEALANGRIKELNAKLSLAKHVELRSKQAHKLSSALLALSEVTDRNHIGFEQPWKVVQAVAREDATLARAVKLVSKDCVERGVYSPAALKQAFHAISYELKRITFLPDHSEMWTIGREAVAHLFANLTLQETGGVIIPIQHEPVSNGFLSTAASAAAVDSFHQSADYAHYINASTYMNSNAFGLALRELESMQPARQATIRRFIEELRKTVQVTEAIGVVRMRVLALNAAAAKA